MSDPADATPKGATDVVESMPPEQATIIEQGGVGCWRAPLVLDTYGIGEPDRYPQFLDRRVYQGSSGRVYPLPMVTSVAIDKAPKAWDAITLENEFVRVVLLPEIGGRIYYAHDKTADYDFFYHNHVIKPALVALAGPWISGGVEFNWPQHHRPGTYLPVDVRIDHEDDGAVAVWHTDIDPLQRMRATYAVRLRPGSSVIEVEANLHNRTDSTQTFLWWANVAARSHDEYQAFFPDDVQYVADHARRAITAFPQADRPYYGVDYPALGEETPGADRIDFYGNILVPTSYMITDTNQSFFGGYDHEAAAGFVHWADRSISPGKKLWTWGNGPVGWAWDDQLTDEDGPYVELMAGVYTDNQPDFSWLLPGETKSFSQYWYPIQQIGPARQASLDAAVSLGFGADGALEVGVATPDAREVELIVADGDHELLRCSGDVAPGRPIVQVLPPDAQPTVITVIGDGRTLVEWRQIELDVDEPWVATAPPLPHEIESNDELYTTATHLGQYRHPSRSPIPYLEEALDRDPGDSRAATMLGAHHLAHGEYEEAHDYLMTAIERLTRRNLNPRDGEAHYLDGLALERLGRFDEADVAFGKAAWNVAWAQPSNLARARLALRRGDADGALSRATLAESIPEARRLQVLALRTLGRTDEADALQGALQQADPLDWGVQALDGPPAVQDPRIPLDLAGELARAGAWDEALRCTSGQQGQAFDPQFGRPGPLVHYLRAMWLDEKGDADAAAAEREAARSTSTELTFPSGLDQYDALMAAVEADPDDAVAFALLGMWLYDAGRAPEALAVLEQAVDAGSTDPVAWRNLALARVAVDNDLDGADEAYVAALDLRQDARLVLERDVLARLRGLDDRTRLQMLDQYRDLIGTRDDLTIEYVNLLLSGHRVDEAWQILTTREFRPFEGGEGQVIAAFDRASIIKAKALVVDDPQSAAELLKSGFEPPHNLGEGRHPSDTQAERYVFYGDVLQDLGDDTGAQEAWRAAVAPNPHAVDPQHAGVADYWRGIAYNRLGMQAEEQATWQLLEDRIDELENRVDETPYFATSVPEFLVFDVNTPASARAEAAALRKLMNT